MKIGIKSEHCTQVGSPLTEDTFRKLPLDFVGNSLLRWDAGL